MSDRSAGPITPEGRYRDLLIALFRELRLEGLAGTGPIALPLEEVYVQLRAVAALPEAGDAFAPEERRLLRLLEERRAPDAELREARLRLDALRQERWTHERPERFPITQALGDADKRGLVILGDPGSGKTTLLHFLALLFAQGPQAVALHTPARGTDAERLPIFVPLAAYDAMLDGQPDLPLQTFLARYYERFHDLPGLGPAFDAAVADGRALILLDGLDEVASEDRRRAVAEQATRLVQQTLPRGNRVLLTSRIYGYRLAPLGGDLPHVTVLDFGRDEIALFTRLWYRAFLRSQNAGLADQPDEQRLLDELAGNPGVERLAVNPLLLTMLVLLRLEQGALPERRIALYDVFVFTLLLRWETLRRRSAGLRDTPPPPDLRATERMLDGLALWLQRQRPSGTATADDLLTALRDPFLWHGHLPQASHDPAPRAAQPGAARHAEDFLRDMRRHSGLLIERGQNAFGFRHQTFQEYFAGRALADLPPAERWALLAPNLHSGRWREPLRLCVARLGASEGRATEAGALVARILDAGSEYESLLHRDLLLAADCAADDSGLDSALLQRIAERLWTLLDAPVPDLARAALQQLFRLWRLRAAGRARLPELEQRLLEWLLAHSAPYSLFGHEPRDLFERMTRDSTPQVLGFLCARLCDPSDSVLSAALGAMSRWLFGNSAEVRALVLAAAADAAPVARRAALTVLKDVGPADPDARRALIAALSDSSEAVRAVVLEALQHATLADDEMRAALFGALDDPFDYVRTRAITALKRLLPADGRVRTALLAALDDPSETVQIAAVDALGVLAPTDHTVRAALLGALAHPNPDVVPIAAHALGGLVPADGAVRTALLAILTDPQAPGWSVAAHALGGLAPADGAVRTALLAALSSDDVLVQSVAVNLLSGLVARDSDVRAALLVLLATAKPGVRASAALALRSLVGSDAEVRSALAVGLGAVWHGVQDSMLAALVPLAAGDPQLAALLDQARRHRDWRVRRSMLPYTTDPAALHACCLDQSCHEAAPAQTAALVVLGTHCLDQPTVRAALLGALTDATPKVRAAAAEALAGAADRPEVRGALLAALAAATSSEAELVRAALAALAGQAPADAGVRDILIAALVGGQSSAQPYAARALGALADGDPGVERLLLGALAAGQQELRRAAAETLGQLVPAGAAIHDALLAAAADIDPEVRAAALRALAPLAHSDPVVRTALFSAFTDGAWSVVSAATEVASGLDPADPAIRAMLLTALGSRNADILSYAVTLLGRLPVLDAELQNGLMALLADGDADIQEAVIEVLGGHVPSDGAIKAALQAISAGSDGWQHLRVDAIGALGGHASTDGAIKASLLGALADPAWDVRKAAAHALGEIAPSDSTVRAALLAALGEEDQQVRTAAAEALGTSASADPATCRALLAALGDSEFSVRAAALHSLGALAPTDAEVRGVLLGALADPELIVRVAAVEGLIPLIPDDSALFTRLLDAVEREDIRFEMAHAERFDRAQRRLTACYAGLVRNDSQRRAELAAALGDPDWRKRRAAVLILAEAGRETALELTSQLIAAAQDSRGDSAWCARLPAAERLINDIRYGDQALELIQEALVYGSDALIPPHDAGDVRQRAARAVGRLKALHRRTDLAAYLAALLETEPDPEVLNGLYAALASLAAAPEPEL